MAGSGRARAVDGTTLRGARAGDGQVHLFAALARGQGRCWPTPGRRRAGRGRWLGAAAAGVEVAGKVVTADALHTRAGRARWLVADRHAEDVVAVKGNQPGLAAAIDRLAPSAVSPRADHG